MDGLVHFSIQQEAKYHDPAFIPVRRARVVDAASQAGIFVVTFEVGDYVALHRSEPSDLRSAVTGYARALDAVNVPRPYGPSLSVGIDVRDGASAFDDGASAFEDGADAYAAFRSSAEILQRTEWFRDARFVRFLSIREGSTEAPFKDGSFRLRAGRTYELTLSHYEPADVTKREPFVVDADSDVIRIIGRPGFDVASRYDVVRIVLHAVASQRHESRETVVTVQPGEGVQGPTIRLPITVYASWRRTLGLLAATASILVVFGLPAVFASWSWQIKFTLVVVGALGASALQNFGWAISLPGGSGFTGRSGSTGQGDGSGGRASLT
jgi:hypothetical protein